MVNLDWLFDFFKMFWNKEKVNLPLDQNGNHNVIDDTPKAMNFRNKITLATSAGHGGLDPITGEYYCLATGKQFKFPDGRVVYEGVLNRIISAELERQGEERGYNIEKVYHEYLDYGLGKRAALATQIEGEVCYLPIHCNASSGHNVRGFQVMTTREVNDADEMAKFIWIEVGKLEKKYSFHKTRKNSLKEPDFELGFGELRRFESHHMETEFTGVNTYLEIGFFDFLPNLELLENPEYITDICSCILDGIDNFYIQNNFT